MKGEEIPKKECCIGKWDMCLHIVCIKENCDYFSLKGWISMGPRYVR